MTEPIEPDDAFAELRARMGELRPVRPFAPGRRMASFVIAVGRRDRAGDAAPRDD